jgi:rhamnose transport system permease protein
MSATAKAESPGGSKPATDTDSPRRLTDLVLRGRTFGIVVILILFAVVTGLVQSSFFNGSNLRYILAETAVFGLLAIGETFVVVTRNVDLSVGSVCGLSAYASADMFQAHPGTSVVVVFLVGIGVGLACGIVTGAITAIGRVPSLVVTLAMLYIIRGVDTAVVGPGQVVANSLPQSFVNIFRDTVVGIPVLAIGLAILTAIAFLPIRA